MDVVSQDGQPVWPLAGCALAIERGAARAADNVVHALTAAYYCAAAHWMRPLVHVIMAAENNVHARAFEHRDKRVLDAVGWSVFSGRERRMVKDDEFPASRR